MSKHKKYFFLCMFFTIFTLGIEIIYLYNKPSDFIVLKNFIKLTNQNSLAFYENSPYLRYRDLKNVDNIFSYHPALREEKIGTFINSSPIK